MGKRRYYVDDGGVLCDTLRAVKEMDPHAAADALSKIDAEVEDYRALLVKAKDAIADLTRCGDAVADELVETQTTRDNALTECERLRDLINCEQRTVAALNRGLDEMRADAADANERAEAWKEKLATERAEAEMYRLCYAEAGLADKEAVRRLNEERDTLKMFIHDLVLATDMPEGFAYKDLRKAIEDLAETVELLAMVDYEAGKR